MKVLLLDGQYSHTVAVASELKRVLAVDVFGVAPGHRSHLHRSRYCDRRLTAPLATDPSYAARIIDLAREVRPDIIVPVGYYSNRRMIDVRDQLPSGVALLAPVEGAFAVAESKVNTYSVADGLGVRFPREIMLEDLLNHSIGDSYPVFAKARLERGGLSTAVIRSREELLAFDFSSLGGDVMLQEYITGESYTYAHSGFYIDGEPVVSFQHQEIRSVPRYGGSGTRLRVYWDDELERLGNLMLGALGYTGVAQVEFKRNLKGQYVLMEINPKFWASYALASRSGVHIASAAVASMLGLSIGEGFDRARRPLEMVFPWREAVHVLVNRRSEGLLGGVASMMWPPAAWDAELRDFWASVPLPSGRRKVGKTDVLGK